MPNIYQSLVALSRILIFNIPIRKNSTHNIITHEIFTSTMSCVHVKLISKHVHMIGKINIKYQCIRIMLTTIL